MEPPDPMFVTGFVAHHVGPNDVVFAHYTGYYGVKLRAPVRSSIWRP